MDPERELFWDPLWSVHRAVLELQGQVRDSRSHDERTLRGDRS